MVIVVGKEAKNNAEVYEQLSVCELPSLNLGISTTERS